MLDLGGIIPPVGSYPCRDCGATIERPGVCDPCAAAFAVREHDATLSAALASIPREFEWARVGAPELRQRIKPLCRLSEALANERVEALAEHSMVLIFGPSGGGKTSLACAALRRIIDLGRYGGTPEAHDVARRARFFAARAIATQERRDDYNPDAPIMSPRAMVARAKAVVIDDVGQEAGGSFRANDRSKLLAEIIADRHDSGAQTIITTFATAEQWSMMYGSGIARRCWDRERVKVVEL